MRLADVANHFDNMPCLDGYNPSTPLFYGQFGVYDDSMRDGLTVERRILSVAPGTTPPAHRVVQSMNKRWVMGDYAPDHYTSYEIRHKYIAHQADGLATVKTIAETLAAQAGRAVYMGMVYVKSAREIEVSSGRFEEYNAYCSITESIPERTMIQLNGAWHLVRTSFRSAAGFRVSSVSELETYPIETATLKARTFNPVTEGYAETSSTVTAIRVRWQDAFEYLMKSSEPYLRGDLQCFLAKSVAVKAEDSLTLSDGVWKVLTVLDEGTYWSLHVRRA